MKIVPTSTPAKKEINLESLMARKAELKQQIQDQRQQVIVSTQHLLTPAPFSNYIFRSFKKGLNVVDGVLIGYRMMQAIRKIFRKRK